MLKRNFESTVPGLNINTKKLSSPLSKNAVAETFSPSRREIKAFLSNKERVLQIKKAMDNLNARTRDRKKAETIRDDFFNTDVGQDDFMTMSENASEDAKKKYKELCVAAENAKTAEKQARRELWSAKYDTMTNSELQAAVVDIEDETEKGYVTTLQGKRVKEKRKKDLETMSAIGDPESVLYDPALPYRTVFQNSKH